MKNKTFFSITIPTYNRSGKLLVTIQSILAQDFKNFEIIVVDNNSSDNTKELIDSLKDKRIKYFKNPVNIGVIKNIQKAIDYSTGQYLLFQSDDDFMIKSNTLSTAHDLLVKNDYGLVRLYYLTKTPNDKKIFLCIPEMNKDFKISKNASDKEVVDFCEQVGTNFFTGIIMKNEFPKNIRIIQSELGFWFNHCFYIVKKYGGYFLADHFYLCSWSMSLIPGTYQLLDGKIPTELFLKNILDKVDYEETGVQLDKYFMSLITVFPAIKYFTDNNNLINLSKRIIKLSPSYKYSFIFWFYLIIAWIAPRPLLHWYRFYRINNIKVGYKIKNIGRLKDYLYNLNEKVKSNKIINAETKSQLAKFLNFSSPSI